LRLVSARPGCLQTIPLTRKPWLAETLEERPAKSALQLNPFTVRIQDRPALVHFGLYVVARADGCPSPQRSIRFDDCAARNFAVSSRVAASFDSFYL
jgi:hypothetical protein